jgi:hypothetical protein
MGTWLYPARQRVLRKSGPMRKWAMSLDGSGGVRPTGINKQKIRNPSEALSRTPSSRFRGLNGEHHREHLQYSLLNRDK